MNAARLESLPSSFLTADPVHPRAVEMAERMREAAGAFGAATYADLIAAGFTSEEIVDHEQIAKALATALFTRPAEPERDRLQDVIVKVIASASHAMPRMAGVEVEPGATAAWGAFCAARAALKIDPWTSQRERCLTLLDRFLSHLPILPREKNRVVYALAAHMKVHSHG